MSRADGYQNVVGFDIGEEEVGGVRDGKRLLSGQPRPGVENLVETTHAITREP